MGLVKGATSFWHSYREREILARDDVEYILSTFTGIHDAAPLLPDGVSMAERIVRKYAEMAFPT
ncbi:MAG: hypothetical protein JW809_06320 [Pirellulales bacterium]|nr:hypothetical protein [Pirellulales bacterium]